MKKLFIVVLVVVAAYLALRHDTSSVSPSAVVRETGADARYSGVPAESLAGEKNDAIYSGEGRVIRVLADDNQGSRHQRFILQLPSGQTLLIAHNIDLVARVENLSIGDTVSFKGEYESNPQGGVVHWTHRDPSGHHAAGWIKHNGTTYQ